MKDIMMRLSVICLFVASSSLGFAADKTWTGTISDSMCGASHAKMIAAHGGKMTDAECAAACVKAGAKYVFVMNGKVYDIANQQFPDLAKEAGHTVRLTGAMKGETITISKLAMAAPAKKS